MTAPTMRQRMEAITRTQAVSEDMAALREEAMERAFDVLMDALDIHESGINSLHYKLFFRGGAKSQLDPRHRLNRWTSQQWEDLNARIKPFFHASIDNSILTITA